jgi:hypothetical protein
VLLKERVCPGKFTVYTGWHPGFIPDMEANRKKITMRRISNKSIPLDY